MGTKFKINDDITLRELLQYHGNEVRPNIDSHNYYTFIPFWFEIDGDDIFMHLLGELPPDLKSEINRQRNTTHSIPKKFKNHFIE
jgi:hypothetical protein